MGPFGLWQKNEDGQRILESAESLDMIITNTWFEKRKEHLITYCSRGRQSQIDYIITRREQKKAVINCKVIRGEAVVAQHRLLVMDMKLKSKKRKQIRIKGKIKTWKLDNVEVQLEFKYNVLRRREELRETDNVDQEWNTMKSVRTEEASQVCGIKKSLKPECRETWWWSEEVQAAVRKKRQEFKRLKQNNSEEA